MSDDLSVLLPAILRGEERAVARACRIVDDRLPEARPLLDALYPNSGRAWLIGVTGSPGAGKSTLVASLVGEYRALGLRVGVLAVDPSSAFNGGAILGDRVRMQRHFGDPAVFIRSLATRGAQGGLSRSAQELGVVLDAAGHDVILIETVGVGQDELDVSEVAESTVVVVAPGMGDDIQAEKSGILEIADLLVVNKCDREGADRALAELEQRLELGRAVAPRAAPSGAWSVPVLKCIALRDTGVSELVAALARHRAWLGTPLAAPRRAAKAQARAERLISALVHERVVGVVEPSLERAAARVVARDLSPNAAVDELLMTFAERALSGS